MYLLIIFTNKVSSACILASCWIHQTIDYKTYNSKFMTDWEWEKLLAQHPNLPRDNKQHKIDGLYIKFKERSHIGYVPSYHIKIPMQWFLVYYWGKNH